ncbi:MULTISPECIES: DUF2190 family protein [unclassified Rhizobium]|jgi:hypothetical protein|uniref:structural cement protein Gp24 n=1 Tax=unclassified Rhizobium TaxID=2613769 RepID=UPI0006472CCF|nr:MULTISPECIES: DUF2190 family protein [unclassified Rhizobium]MBN8951441.1 DUF2190 family protein [Rhizobium tropici]MDK4701107.1 DUF2190 family protein [Rhizobium sp. CNPSo 4062]OJY74747.1 MAG: hypothetical protein BGP09_33475 [Rhizobium sp. 60-20]RKD66745.1 hypothetical protein BJ928_106273 [Rhizobium sp. WW_1]
MATYQTTYGNAPRKGLHGQIASEEKANKISRTVETAAGIKFGQPVQRGLADHGVAPFAAGGKFIGIAVLTPNVLPDVAPAGGYAQFVTGAFLTSGQMYVRAGGAVSDGDAVYYNPTTDAYVNAAGTGIVGPIPDCFFDTSGSNGDIVEISLKHRSA